MCEFFEQMGVYTKIQHLFPWRAIPHSIKKFLVKTKIAKIVNLIKSMANSIISTDIGIKQLKPKGLLYSKLGMSVDHYEKIKVHKSTQYLIFQLSETFLIIKNPRYLVFWGNPSYSPQGFRNHVIHSLLFVVKCHFSYKSL